MTGDLFEEYDSLLDDPRTKDLNTLEKILRQGFSLEELRRLIFYQLDLSYDDFPTTKRDFIFQLIRYCKRRNMLDWLVHAILDARYQYADDKLIAILVRLWKNWGGRIYTNIKVAIIAAGDLFAKFDQFKETLAEYLQIKTDEIHILKAATGSTHLLISLPDREADKLLRNQGGQLRETLAITFMRPLQELDGVSQKAWYHAPKYVPPDQSEAKELQKITWSDLIKKAEESIRGPFDY